MRFFANLYVILNKLLAFIYAYLHHDFICRHCPMLDVELPDLVPELRPYQSRAACWMVQREKVALQDSSLEWEHSLFHSPLCVAMNFLDSCSRMFYNPFRYV